MWMELNSSLLTYAIAYKLTALLQVFITIAPFSQPLRHKTDMVVFYHAIPYYSIVTPGWLQHRNRASGSTSIVMSSDVHNY